MASFSLVHGAWGLGLQWDLVRAELEARGHLVHTPDLPCEDVEAGVEEYAAAVPACDVVVGHSLGGLTIPYVDARTRVFLCALVGDTGSWDEIFVEGFAAGRERDELGRSYYPDPAVAAAEMQYPAEQAHLAELLRRQAPYGPDPRAVEHAAYVVCSEDAVIRPAWQRHLARAVLGVEPIELAAGHMPMLERPRELAELLDSLA
ncbi:MAG TPA: alpha/beta hydrolase [Gaiellaceae bacterium]|nr:alpha/beta hydrolase [Gaiellaceae bacterium]